MKHLKFIGLSVMGFLFFLMPVTFNGESKIMISHIVNGVTTYMLDSFITLTIIMSWIVLVMTLIFTVYTSKSNTLNDVFKTSPLNVLLRVLGSLLYLMVVHQWLKGNIIADVFIDPNTGGVMVGDEGLLTTLYITFLVGILALPLLTHFGVVEFIGTLLGPVVVKLFKVPGYSTIDAIASFVGDGTIGIVVTDQQYQRGYYNRREAYIIATSFSIVGIAFAAAVAEELRFGHIFPIFYGSIVVITILLAFITSRMPLKKFTETYYPGTTPKSMAVPNDISLLKHSYNLAIKQADQVRLFQVLKEALLNVINIYVGFLPIIMTVGTLSLIIAEYTPFFSVISLPFTYLYEWLGYAPSTAEMMAPASLAGFADMYLPALFITSATSEASRFFIGVLAFTQLVFLSETGMILVKTKIGLNFIDIVKVFLFRTLFSIPFLYLITQLLVWQDIIQFY
ncbi:nucleoside recognition GATE domain-containing membrane protein YjiH [Halolactibacillus halophilus]|uniref:Membrane protein n=1 Tax=Halolactibacillus halophilus TaxID=306540 RepID=A0A1I5NHU2_9BACI|nr:nucleoside recognition domain-containing protein [Halolactibacillus halophilus]GEM01345.1 membrane protein [Halolactibacillus halophilus]SFP21373.1 nucleoside recognition GATE domain-containing membrane protein YjiH [Halolactibacillus halophilus]